MQLSSGECHRTIFNTLRPRQIGRHFADIFKCIFVNENVWILLNISLKFVPRVRIYNTAALVQIMAWRRPGDKPLSEPVMVSLLTHIWVTRPQWVNDKSTLILVIAAITWTNVDKDLWCHMASSGKNELTHCSPMKPYGVCPWFWTTLVAVMAYCLMAQSITFLVFLYYQNYVCWQIID